MAKRYITKALLIIFTCLISGIAYAQSGSITGKIATKDGQPISSVNIIVKELNRSTITEADGTYQLKSVKEGQYTLIATFIGLTPIERSVRVNSGQAAIIDFTFQQDANQMAEVIVNGKLSLNQESISVGKLPVKAKDLPQSLTVISKETMERQQVQQMADVLRNVNGVYIMGNSGGYQDEVAGRGYAFTSSNTFKNGTRFNNAIKPEFSSLERVEVLKGSSAILYGNVAPGGVLNMVTKKPVLGTHGGEISMRVGSYDFYKPFFDFYGPFNNSKKAAYRVNAVYEKSRSYRDEVKAARFYINPSFLFRIGNKTDILVEGDYLNDDRTADYGTGAVNYKIADVPRNRFLGAKWSYVKTEQYNSTATITHHLNSSWQLNSVTSYYKFNNDLFSTTRPNSGNFVQTDGKWIRGLQRTGIDEQYYITQLDLTGKFNTGFLGHNLLVGADADKYLTNTKAYNVPSKYDSINIYDLDVYKQRTDIPTVTEKTLTTAPVSRLGVYAQDLVEILHNLKFLAGIRYTYQHTGSDVLYYANDSTTTSFNFAGAFTPRLGLVYQPFRSTSIFASYANSFVLNTGQDVNGKALAPSYINQYEAGIKNDLFNGLLSANLTVYQIVNSNLAQMSLANGNNNANIKELAGEVTSKGVELDIMSRSYHGFSLIAGYSYNDTRYTKSNTYIVGSKLRYNPAHTANASLFYAFDRKSALRGLDLGISALYFGDRVAGRSTRLTVNNDAYKLMDIPSYTQFDASIGYAISNFSVRVKVSNLTDVLSYNVHDDNSVNPIAPRQFMATFAYKF